MEENDEVSDIDGLTVKGGTVREAPWPTAIFSSFPNEVGKVNTFGGRRSRDLLGLDPRDRPMVVSGEGAACQTVLMLLACRAVSSCCCLTIAQLVCRHFDLSEAARYPAVTPLAERRCTREHQPATYRQLHCKQCKSKGRFYCTASPTKLLLMHEGQTSLAKADVWHGEKAELCFRFYTS
ncbi:hypothetical protein PAMA_006742 [Pampus argenteus]